ncbi:hypothetical protein [Nocardia amikacinitolerans]|uniref:hypothetical protein n=1 Tax=Nocardia amikacinitolerans TaxID=756689 RepID=UPI0012EED034|nr:hypothetical protein [Nocardia amikacinitolerans]
MVALLMVLAPGAALAACASERSASSASETQDASPAMPPRNPWLADSAYPISHVNSAATDSTTLPGPDVGRPLSVRDTQTHPTVFTSNPTVKTVGADSVILAAGAHGIDKFYATDGAFRPVGFLPYPGHEDAAAKADPKALADLLSKTDEAYRAKDEARLLELSKDAAALGFNRDNIANGAYNMIDRDGFHYVAISGMRIVKSTDDNDPHKPLRVDKVVDLADILPTGLPANVVGAVSDPKAKIVALGMTYDGHIVAAASAALFLLDRDLTIRGVLPFQGEQMENNVAIDESGIYAVTSRHMMKVVWTGDRLSTEEADGGWVADYDTMSPEQATAAGALTLSGGSGTTPTLMGFGDDADELVVISDANPNGPNLVAFWRDRIPEGFTAKPGARSARIAGQVPIDVAKVTIELSPNVVGYGALVASTAYPDPVRDIWGNVFTAGVTRPAPMGLQKFQWDPETDSFTKKWANREIDNSDVIVPGVSASTGLIYAANKSNGVYEITGVDWETGRTAARWPFPDDSRMWNCFGGITGILDNGDLLVGGLFSVKRIHAGPA